MKNTGNGAARVYLREWREARGLSLGQMRELSALGKATMSRIETGKQPYYRDILEIYAKIIGCTPGDLISRPPGDVDELWRIFDSIPRDIRSQLAGFAKIMIEHAAK